MMTTRTTTAKRMKSEEWGTEQKLNLKNKLLGANCKLNILLRTTNRAQQHKKGVDEYTRLRTSTIVVYATGKFSV